MKTAYQNVCRLKKERKKERKRVGKERKGVRK
jgi:hypothetical protein